jgi:hypothetical protein
MGTLNAPLRAAALVLAAALPALAADSASLHKSIQGRWRADPRSVAEQTPEWKGMTEDQRAKALSMIPTLEFDISATRIVFLAPGTEDKDEPLDYRVLGAEGRKLKLTGRDATGAEKPFTIEVAGADTLHLAVPDAPVFKLVRVKSSPRPAP